VTQRIGGINGLAAVPQRSQHGKFRFNILPARLAAGAWTGPRGLLTVFIVVETALALAERFEMGGLVGKKGWACCSPQSLPQRRAWPF